MAGQETFDFVIAGGGQAGVVLASRLSQALPSMTVALLEAGPDAHDDPTVDSPLGCAALHHTDFEWNYMTAPQRSLNGRTIYNCSGKVLSGSSAVNYGAWTRGHAADFDHWAKLVGDKRWSYKSMLPCFKKVETHYMKREDTPNADEHGFDGPIRTIPPEQYPMRDLFRRAFLEAGIKSNADANSGNPQGVSSWVQSWHNFRRQAAGQVYDLSKVIVRLNSLVHRVVLDSSSGEPRAVGVELADGAQIHARKEVIVSCGALRTPQILMLSGIGEAQRLKALGVAQKIDLPDVGQNLHDHPSILQYFKLKHPEKGLSFGSATFPPLKIGPSEWVLTMNAPRDRLIAALKKDGVASPESHPSVASTRMHYEMVVGYVPIGVPPEMGDKGPPADGSIIAAGSVCFMPTSRGSVTLSSADPAAAPVIDPNYLSTEHDMEVLRSAMRQTMSIMSTSAAMEEVAEEWQPEDCSIGLNSTDAELDARIKPYSSTWYHPAGTASMGKVVDAECCVMGAQGLRVLDASIIPAPIAAHLQATVYATAENVAQMMATAYGARI